jgi:hypothetical protein
MSNAFALAAVTAALRQLLRQALAAPGLDAALGVAPEVSVLPPDRVNPAGGADPERLNLFLRAVTPNPGWGNRDLPAREATGARRGSPPLALDLHYLLSAYSASNYGAEILLGLGMQALHETPVLSRPWLRQILVAGPPPDGLPAVLATTGLPEQVEQVRITPAPLSTDESSKIWTALQTHYRPTAAYIATVVLLETTRATREAPPVRARTVTVVPWSGLRLDRAEVADDPAAPIVAGATLRLSGAGLGGHGLRVELGGRDLTDHVVRRTATELDVQLPDPLPAGVRAGLLAARVVQPLVGAASFASNAVGVLLRPQLGAPAFAAGVVTVPLAPPVGRDQAVVLLLDRRGPPAAGARGFAFRAPFGNGAGAGVEEVTAIAFPVPGVPAGDWLVRVQVDGAESLLRVDPEGRYDAPFVTIP